MEVKKVSRKSSTVWSHFDKKEDGKNECKHCKLLLSTTAGSNLKRHLIKLHPTLNIESKGDDKPLVSTCRSLSTSSSSRRSPIWNHFDAVEGSKGKCKHCRVVLTMSSGSTSNLKRHLKLKHPKISLESNVESNRRSQSPLGPSPAASSDSEMETAENTITINCPEVDISTSEIIVETDIPESELLPLQFSLENFVQVPVSLNANRDKNVDLQLLKTICKGYHMFNLVEDSEFKKLISLLCPGYNLPTQKSLRRSLLPQVYDELVVKLKQEIGNATAVALSTNCWTSSDNHNFLTITAHYLNKNTTLCSSMLACIEFNENHDTQINFYELLKDFCKDWEVSSKITAIVTDNTPNIVSAVKKCQWKHIYCYAHCIKSIVNSGVKPVDHIINKFKSLIEYFSKSSHARAILHSSQKRMGFPKLKLTGDVSTLWESTYDLLSHIFFNRTPIISTLEILKNDNFKISADEWILCDHLIKLLGIFEDVIKEISSENSVSLPKIIIFTRSLLSYVVSYKQSSNLPNLVIQVCNILEAEINVKLVDAGDHVEFKYEAAFLDPRFKKSAFGKDLKKYKQVYDSIVPQIQTLLNSEPNYPVISIKPLWTAYDIEFASLNGSHHPRDLSIKELDNFLAEPALPRTSDPLVWWDQNKLTYPHLYQLVLKRLCIPASSIPSKHISVKAGQILAEEQNDFDLSELSQILFLNNNL